MKKLSENSGAYISQTEKRDDVTQDDIEKLTVDVAKVVMQSPVGMNLVCGVLDGIVDAVIASEELCDCDACVANYERVRDFVYESVDFRMLPVDKNALH